MAERSGVSKATISKIEREELSPTAVILVRLAGAFDLTLAGLLCVPRARSAAALSRAADQPVWRDPETGYSRRQVFGRPDHPVEIIQVEMPAGQKRCPAGLVLRADPSGGLGARQANSSLPREASGSVLATGDCLGFGAPCGSHFRQRNQSPCTYLVVLARS